MPRMIRCHAAFAALAVASLALAVGANLTVFTVVNALWLKPLPIRNVDRLVILTDDSIGSNDAATFGGVERADRWTAFEAVAGQVVTNGQLGGLRPHIILDQLGREVETLAVTSQYFSLFGLSIRGRDFTRDDNRQGSEPVAIISDRLWATAFRRRVDVIGSVAQAKPFPIRIIGIAPAGFEGARRGERAELWIPSNLVPRVSSASAISEDAVPSLVFARLRPGQTRADAERRLVEDATSEWDRRIRQRLHVVSLKDVFGSPNARTIVIREQRAGAVVAGLAALVLFAGCATLMTLLLVHYERRRRELALRLSLGASRLRLATDLSKELMWLIGGGTAGALLVASWSLRALPTLTLPGGVDLGRLDLSIDSRVLLAGLSITIATLAVAVSLPMSRFTHTSLASELTASGATPPVSSQRLRAALLGLHVAATIVVLIAAGLFVRAVIQGFSAGPRFEVGRTVYVRVQVVSPFVDSGTSWDTREALIAENSRRIATALRALPSVELVASGPPPIGQDQASFALVPGTIETEYGTHELRVGVLSGSPDLLRAIGIPILAGRALTSADAAATPLSVVMTTSMARRLWPSEDPLGKVLSYGPRRARYLVVGVVPDFVYGSLSNPAAGVLVTVSSEAYGGMEPQFVIRTTRPDSVAEPIRRVVLAAVPDAPQVVISTGRQIVARDLGRQRLGAWFFSGFGLVALLLGTSSVFGLVAYMVQSRRRELGVRLALGSTPGALLRSAIVAGLTPVFAGVVLGLGVGGVVAHLFISLLPGLNPLDPSTYLVVATIMLSCAGVAGLVAALRLYRLAPGEALRTE